MEELKNQSHWWWFDNREVSKRSPWLTSKLAALEKKTKGMLKLIEEDADSFAQRAEMYYKKRPELVSMVEDFYREHRSMAEKLDMVKCKDGNETKFIENAGENSELDDPYSQESDVEDPEEGERNQKEVNGGEVLREEGKKDNPTDRDEEKREAIRQLSIAVQILKEENWMLRRNLMESRFRKKSGVLRLHERFMNICGRE